MSIQAQEEKVVFAGGCFWCTEAIFMSLKGVISVIPGYTGGNIANPTYEQVSAGNTGHVEAVMITYDPKQISFDDLLAVFFNTHDPTTPNRQGNDVGPQYNSMIFFTTLEQEEKAKKFVSKVRPWTNFYPAEDYHQKYYEHHKDAPYCEIVIAPKLEKLQKRFKDLIKHE